MRIAWGCVALLVFGCGSSVSPRPPDVGGNTPQGLGVFGTEAPAFVSAEGSCAAANLLDGGTYPADRWGHFVAEARNLAFAAPSSGSGCTVETYEGDALVERRVMNANLQPVHESQWKDGSLISDVTHHYEGGRETARTAWSVVDGAHEETWRYDEQGRPAEVDLTRDGGVSEVDSFSYSDAGRLLSMTDVKQPDGWVFHETGYTYDPEGGIVSIKDTWLSWVEGLDRESTFDERGRPVSSYSYSGQNGWSIDYRYPTSGAPATALWHQYANESMDQTATTWWGQPDAPQPLQISVSTTQLYQPTEKTLVDGTQVIRRAYDESGRLWLEGIDSTDDCTPDEIHQLRYDPKGVLRDERYLDAAGSTLKRRIFIGADCPADASASPDGEGLGALRGVPPPG